VAVVPSLFPTSAIRLNDGPLAVNQLYISGVAIVIAVLLAAAYRYTRLGLATQAASENERGAALMGFSPTTVAALNWAIGFALGALGGVLITTVESLDSSAVPLLIFPALAAALVGRFSSFGLTTVAAFAIGWAEILVFHLWPQQGGAQTAAPFVLVVLVVVVLGRTLPTRGAVSEGRPPKAPSGSHRWIRFTVCIAAALVLLATMSGTYQLALDTSMVMGIGALSLVVVTGYCGQISLMQATFMGLGGLFTAKIAGGILGIPFPFSIVLAAVVIAPASVLIALPALRVRGLSLAVVTLGCAVAVDALLFQSNWAGGAYGLSVPSPHLWGLSLDPFEHPDRYGIFALIVLALVAFVVGNLRRSATGRQMLAVRTNERAAAVAGVNVWAVKLKAFALSGTIAAIGGGVLAYSNPFFATGTGNFGASPSITLVTVVYIGGVASVAGGVLAGVIASGGLVYVLLSHISGFENYYLIITGVGLVWTVVANPDGVAPYFGEHVRLPRIGALARAGGRAPARDPDGAATQAPPDEPVLGTLTGSGTASKTTGRE
jgi:branched-chain amino acid transport system permease protein